MAIYMVDIAKLCGVEIGEEFAITCYSCLFRFTYEQLEMKEEKGVWFKASSEFLEDILYEKQQIIKLPWQPKEKEKYWSFSGHSFSPNEMIWSGTIQDLMRSKCGVVFRTKEEAIKARPRIYHELTGKEWRREIAYGLGDNMKLL